MDMLRLVYVLMMYSHSYLMTNHTSCFSSLIRLQHALLEASLTIRTPIGFPGIIRLEHVCPLHVHGDDEVGRRIGIRLTGLSKLDVARHVELILDGLNNPEITKNNFVYLVLHYLGGGNYARKTRDSISPSCKVIKHCAHHPLSV